MKNNSRILEEAFELLPFMTEIRRHIHRNPGCGFDNADTIGYVKQVLEDIGIESEYIGTCGLCALVGDTSKPCVLLRAETDGLPASEQTGLEFASENGNMHLCGHDLHTAQLIGAAKIIKQHIKDLNVCVKFMFQSAEENLCGALDMIENGILESPVPTAAFMLHVLVGSELETGTVIVPKAGESAPAADFFRVDIYGKGCHGSSPVQGKDPLYTACGIVTALSHINSRELAFGEKAVLTAGSLNAGSSANVIPDTAVLSGTLRCFGNGLREKLKRRITEICKKTAECYETKASVTFTGGCPSLINSGVLCRYAHNRLSDAFGNGRVTAASSHGADTPSGSEDFAYITQKVPSAMLALCAGSVRDGYVYPLHHPKVIFDERAMAFGCAAHASFALGFGEDILRDLHVR